MEKKMTYIDAIDMALEGKLTEEAVEKLEALKASIAKRNAHKSGKPTKAQVANEALKDEILAFLGDGEAHTIAEIVAGAEGLEGASPQKMSALLSQLKSAGLVIREEVKRKAYFKLA